MSIIATPEQLLSLGFFPIAMGLGALHALEPGHAKSLTASFLIGIKGTKWDAVWLGLSVAVTHTAVVIGLAVVVAVLGKESVPDIALRGLELGSALVVIVLGIWMLVHRWRHAKMHRDGHPHHHHHVPDYVGHGVRPTRLQIIAFGAAGGVLPCPASITVMLLALSIGKSMSGLIAVIGFSLGLATTLVLFGVIIVSGISRFNASKGLLHRVSEYAPVASAIMVIASGAVALISHW